MNYTIHPSGFNHSLSTTTTPNNNNVSSSTMYLVGSQPGSSLFVVVLCVFSIFRFCLLNTFWSSKKRSLTGIMHICVSQTTHITIRTTTFFNKASVSSQWSNLSRRSSAPQPSPTLPYPTYPPYPSSESTTSSIYLSFRRTKLVGAITCPRSVRYTTNCMTRGH